MSRFFRSQWVISIGSLALATACGKDDSTNEQVVAASSLVASSASGTTIEYKHASFGVSSTPPTTTHVQPSERTTSAYVPHRVLFKSKETAPTAATKSRSLAASLQGKLTSLAAVGAKIRRAQVINAVRDAASNTTRAVYSLDIDPANAMPAPEIARRLAKEPEIEWAEPDWLNRLHASPDDPSFPDQAHLQQIGAPTAWNTTTGAASTVVAIIDTGVDWHHPELAANIWTNSREIPGDGLDNDGNGYVDDVHGWDFIDLDASQVGPNDEPGPPDNDPSDDVGHGTHVSGIVGARGNNAQGISGVDWSVSLMPLRAGYSGGLPNSAIAEAIYYAANNGAHIISMSFGGEEPSKTIRDAIQYASEHGSLLVAAAGNSDSRRPEFPAMFPNVLTVGALDGASTRAYFSSFGPHVDIAAPGSNILSTLPGGEYGYASGTSMATPIVSGVAALIKSAHPTWSAEEIRRQLLATAHSVDESNPYHVGYLGAGRVDAALAVGAKPSQPSASIASVRFEDLGDGDGELEPGESVSVLAGVHNWNDATPFTLSATSRDPYVSVTTGDVDLGAIAPDRIASGRLTLAISNAAPIGHRATVELRVHSGSFAYELPVAFTLADAFRRPEKIFPYMAMNTVPLSGGRMAIVADDVRSDIQQRIYASIREPTGAFSPAVTLSDPTRHAGQPNAQVDSAGNLHVLYRQYDANHQNPSLAYRRWDAATNTWSAPETASSAEAVVFWFFPQNYETLGIDSAGRPHAAWLDIRSGIPQIRTSVRQASGWVEAQVVDLPPSSIYAWSTFVEVPNGNLGLFYTHSSWGNPDSPYQLRQWNGTSWGPTQDIAQATSRERSTRPFRLGPTVNKFYRSGESFGNVDRAHFDGSSWVFDRTITADFGNLDLETEVGIRQFDGAQFGLVASFELPETLGAVRRYAQVSAGSTQWSDLQGSPYHVGLTPTVQRDAANRHHLTMSEYRLELIQGARYLINTYGSYYTDGNVPLAARPNAPVVTDDGASTATGTSLHATWSSSHPTGISHYEVAIGTVPGGDDVMPWLITTRTDQTFSLVDTPLQPGQIYYVSVQAVSNGIYRSGIGASNGITYLALPRCTAAPWESTIAYQDPGIRVTYQNRTYQNLWYHAGVTPGTGGPWRYVEDCAGEPVLPPCQAPSWSPSVTYDAGARVSYNRHEYEALWYNLGQIPTGMTGNVWKWQSTCRASN